jgi:non-heme chloroperoxidase
MTHRSFVRCLAGTSIVALILTASAVATMAQDKKFKQVWVKTPDGLTISAQDWGNPAGPEIVFIHGFSQSHLSWIKQVTGDLAKDFHMVTYDLRGHGNSDKPLEPERYKDSKAWADELQAVMDATGIKRPVLAGWSYGGRIMADYLRIHGPDKLAGLNYVDAGQKADPAFVGPNLKNLPLMASEDLAVNIAATRAFLRDCFSKQPTPEEYETMLAFNMMVPPKVRLGLSNRPLNIDDIMTSLKLPVLVTHGSEDKNSNLIAAEYTAKMIPGARLSVYQGIGHSPFFEDAVRFKPSSPPSCAAPRSELIVACVQAFEDGNPTCSRTKACGARMTASMSRVSTRQGWGNVRKHSDAACAANNRAIAGENRALSTVMSAPAPARDLIPLGGRTSWVMR